MSSPTAGDFDYVEEPDLRLGDVSNFEGRLPDPTELVRWGGRPGVQYLMIDSRNLHEATNDTDEAGKKWLLTRDGRVHTVTGPGGVTTIMILCKGKPVEGADPANGIRQWFYDRTILQATGLPTPYGGAHPVNGHTPTPTTITTTKSAT